MSEAALVDTADTAADAAETGAGQPTQATLKVVPLPVTAADEEVEAERRRPAKAWYSGWCGAGTKTKGGTCNDGLSTNKAGERIYRCGYEAENGARAPRPYLFCACTCHRDPNGPGQALAHHDGED